MYRTELKRIRHAVQKGFSLLELVVVMVVVFGLIGLGLSVAPQLFASMNSVGELSELPAIILNIKKHAKNSSTYNGVTLDTLVRSNVFPENRVTIPAGAGGATATNQWGGAVTAAVGTITTTDDIVRLGSRSVPKAECVEVVQGVGKMLRRIYVDPNDSGTIGAGTLVKADNQPVNQATLASTCANSNTITYDIGKS